MGKKVDVCSVDIGKIIYIYRIVSDGKVEAIYRISKEECTKIRELLYRKGYEGILTKIWGVPSMCITYYNVDNNTIKEITKYGKLIPQPWVIE